MKKAIYIVSLLLSVTFYCCNIESNKSVISTYADNCVNEELSNSNVNSLLFGTYLSEKSITTETILNENGNNSITANFKTLSKNTFTFLKSKELLQLSQYTKFIFYSKHILILFNSTDIVFPFHSFW